MALRPMATLVEMTAEVLARCGLGVQGELTVDLHPQIHGFLREAQKTYWQRFPQLRTRVRREITLTANIRHYDVPDDFELGSIEQVAVRTSDSMEWTLQPGIRSSDRSLADQTATSSDHEPSRYDFYDGVIELMRAPSANVTTMVLTGHLGPAMLIADQARPTVDDEALIRCATIKLQKFKKHITGAEAAAEMAELEGGYIADLDANQGTGETFLLGGQYDDPNEDPSPHRRDRPWWLANRRP